MEWYGRPLAWQEKSLGKEHRDTLATLRSMGNVFLAIEDYTSAIQCYEWVYAGLEKALGKEHPDTLAAPALLHDRSLSSVARDESRMARDESRMTGDYCRPEESIHRCVRTHSHLY